MPDGNKSATMTAFNKFPITYGHGHTNYTKDNYSKYYVNVYFMRGPFFGTLHSSITVYQNQYVMGSLNVVAKSHNTSSMSEDPTEIDGFSRLCLGIIQAVKDVSGFGSSAAHSSLENYTKNDPTIAVITLPVSEAKANEIVQYIQQVKSDMIGGTKKYAAFDVLRQRMHRQGKLIFMNCNTATKLVTNKAFGSDASLEENKNRYVTTGYSIYRQLKNSSDSMVHNPIDPDPSPQANPTTIQQAKLSKQGLFGGVTKSLLQSFNDAMEYKTKIVMGRK